MSERPGTVHNQDATSPFERFYRYVLIPVAGSVGTIISIIWLVRAEQPGWVKALFACWVALLVAHGVTVVRTGDSLAKVALEWYEHKTSRS